MVTQRPQPPKERALTSFLTLLRRIPVPLVWVLGLLPAVWLIWQLLRGGLGADPLKALEHGLGLHAFQFLLLTLSLSPLKALTALNLLPYRRALGLITFVYALAHVSVWLSLDLQFRWAEIATDLTKRPYIILGMVALILLTPLTLTSNGWSLRRLGPQAWRRLHLLVWPAGFAAAAHFILVAKTWRAESLIYLAALILLLLLRVFRQRPPQP